MERGRKMTENSYKTPSGCIHYFVNIVDKQKITLVFLPGLTADHRLFEKQIEYFEKKQNVFVWDAPSHALSRPFTNNYSLSDMAQWLCEIFIFLNGSSCHIKIKSIENFKYYLESKIKI